MTQENIHILLADSHAQSRDRLSSYLTHSPYTLELHETSTSVLDSLKSNPKNVDVFLLDIDLDGECSALDCLKAIKADKDLFHIPVIIQTETYDHTALSKALSLGAYYFLEDTADADLVQAVFNSAIDHKERYEAAIKEAREFKQGVDLVHEARFYIRTLDDIGNISKLLCSVFPDPEAVGIGIHELLTNAIEHGNLGISYDEKSALVMENRWHEEVKRRLDLPEYQNKLVEVILKKSDFCIELTITDQGFGFDSTQFMEIDPARMFDPHGRGIAMAKSMSFDEVNYIGCGNQVICVVHLDKE